jgi:hypothetical protein
MYLHGAAYNKSCLNKLQSIQHIESLIAIQQLIWKFILCNVNLEFIPVILDFQNHKK